MTVGCGVGAIPSLKTSIQRASVPPLATTLTSGSCKTGKPSRQCSSSASASPSSHPFIALDVKSLGANHWSSSLKMPHLLLPIVLFPFFFYRTVVLFCFFLMCFLLNPLRFLVDYQRWDAAITDSSPLWLKHIKQRFVPSLQVQPTSTLLWQESMYWLYPLSENTRRHCHNTVPPLLIFNAAMEGGKSCMHFAKLFWNVWKI